MAFKDFFKKRQKQPATPEERTLTKKELADWLTQQQTTLRKQEQQVLREIDAHAAQLIKELTEHQEIIRDIDISEAPADKRAKTIVRGNINKYLFYTETLQKKLIETNEERLATRIHHLKTLLTDFFTQSEPNYQKATFLIGQELAATKESVKTFTQYIEQIMQEQQGLTEQLHSIDNIQEAYEELTQVDDAITETNQELHQAQEHIKELTTREHTIKEEITAIKNSAAYKEQEKKKKEREQALNKLQRDTQQLQQTIDFKALRAAYHTNKKHMRAIKELQKDFLTAYKKDHGTTLQELLREAQLLTQDLKQRIEQVNEQRKNLGTTPPTTNKELTRLTEEQRSINHKQHEITQDINAIQKRQQKLIQQQLTARTTLETTLQEQHITLQHTEQHVNNLS